MTKVRIGYELIDCSVLKNFLFMRLVSWKVKESWDGMPPYYFYTRTKWVTIFRVIDDEKNL